MSKTGLATAPSGANLGRLPLFVAKLPIGADDSINFHELGNQPAGNSKFFINFGIPAPRNPDTFTAAEFKEPRLAPPGNGAPESMDRFTSSPQT
jgi:hypothetical protein